ncbi:GntR family transcriptional regulator [Streptomyces sp. NPDC050560]|uniref:GntR family transcriptional regulator n=1 Tax=Streptomyces sp. NPDC050560 TaxID=3365630 RepID=UPI0037AB353F
MRHATMRGPAVTRSTLRQQIAEALRDEVLGGRLHPGREFTVREIADLYGVSATPVREALVDLSAQGLLESVQHRGFRVHEYSAEDYRGMVEARGMVADGIYRELTGRYTRGELPIPVAALTAVRRRGEEAGRAACAGELTVLIGYDLRFWRELNSLFGNPYLAAFLDQLRVRCWVCAVPVLRRAEDLRGRLWGGHTGLVDALLDGDPVRAHGVFSGYNAHALTLLGPPPGGECAPGEGAARGD